MTEEQQKGYYERVTEEREQQKRQSGRPVGSRNKKKKEEENSTEIEKKEGWELHDVIPVYRNNELVKYSCSVSIEQIAQMYLSGNIIYNENVQRGTKTDSKGNVVEIFQRKKVKDIYKALAENRLHCSVITLNANKDTGIELNYDEGILSGNKPLDLLDGNHRIKAMVALYKDYHKAKKDSGNINPAEWEIPLVIENLSEDDSCSLFSEYSLTPLKVSRTRGLFLDVYNAGNMIVRHLMKNSELRNKIDCINVGLRNEYVATFGTLANAINTYLKPKTEQQAENYKDYTTNFFNTLANTFSEAFGNVSKEERKEVRSKSFVIEPVFMNAYVNLLENLIGKEDWEGKIGKLKDEIQVGEWNGSLLSRQNPYWLNNITRGNGKMVSTRSTVRFVANSIVNYIMHGQLIDKIEEQQ
jgi:hypothetical protein